MAGNAEPFPRADPDCPTGREWDRRGSEHVQGVCYKGVAA